MLQVSVSPRPFRRGFTLLELVVVLLVLSVMAIAAVPRVPIDVFTVESQAQRFASDLRRAQLLASNSAIRVCFALIGNAGYALYPVDSSGACSVSSAELNDPATGQKFRVMLANNATVASTSGTVPVIFNTWGAPSSGPAAFRISGQITISVAATTGFVSVSSIEAP